MARNWHLERYPGKHVAIDMRTDEVVLVADTPVSYTHLTLPTNREV